MTIDPLPRTEQDDDVLFALHQWNTVATLSLMDAIALAVYYGWSIADIKLNPGWYHIDAEDEC